MKKILLLTGMITTGFAGNAQSIEDGARQIYYERYNSAENTFKQLVKADPMNAEAWFGLSKTYLLQNKADEAITTLRSAPATVYTAPYYKAAIGWALLSQDKKDSAALYFGDALKQTKEKDAAILSAVAQAHIESKPGDAAYAVEILNKAIKRNKHNAELYVQLGDAYRKTANGTEAYKAYKKALEENDRYAVAYHKLGQIFLTQKNAEMYLDYFGKAVAADAAYAPSHYKLYLYQFYHDPAKALVYYNSYMANADASAQNEYDLADLLYLDKQYDAAIQKAKRIISTEGDKTQGRIYKLISYSYAAEKDTTSAITYMQQYFDKAPDSLFIAKDYATMSDLYGAESGQDSLAGVYLAKAVTVEKDSAALFAYYKKLADIAAERKAFGEQANWLSLYYPGNNKATNLDLFYWGVAHYRADEYPEADSVFGLYVAKYPEQSFGYYWQAKSKALIDSGMQAGLAIPAYQKLIEVLQKDTADANYKKWAVEAYNYLAAYEANKEKDYAEAVGYFEKVLEVEPNNEQAKKYIAILEKRIEK